MGLKNGSVTGYVTESWCYRESSRSIVSSAADFAGSERNGWANTAERQQSRWPVAVHRNVIIIVSLITARIIPSIYSFLRPVICISQKRTFSLVYSSMILWPMLALVTQIVFL